MKFLDVFFPKKYCIGCGAELKDNLFYSIHKKDWLIENICINKVLGYNLTEEMFEPSSRVYFFKEGHK